MNVWDYLDRVGERNIQRPMNTKLVVGFSFLLGYYFLLYSLLSTPMPATNAPLIRDAFLVLGPPVGAIVGALFRTDTRDEQQTANTARAFRAIEATAVAGGASTPALKVDPDAKVDTVKHPDGSTTQIVTAPTPAVDTPERAPWER